MAKHGTSLVVRTLAKQIISHPPTQKTLNTLIACIFRNQPFHTLETRNKSS